MGHILVFFSSTPGSPSQPKTAFLHQIFAPTFCTELSYFGTISIGCQQCGFQNSGDLGPAGSISVGTPTTGRSQGYPKRMAMTVPDRLVFILTEVAPINEHTIRLIDSHTLYSSLRILRPGWVNSPWGKIFMPCSKLWWTCVTRRKPQPSWVISMQPLALTGVATSHMLIELTYLDEEMKALQCF